VPSVVFISTWFTSQWKRIQSSGEEQQRRILESSYFLRSRRTVTRIQAIDRTEELAPIEERVFAEENRIEEGVFVEEEPFDLNRIVQQVMANIDPSIRAIDSLKSFHGTSQENSRDWLDRAEIIFNVYRVNDVDRLARIGIKFEDSAFDWYRDNQGPYASWNAFREAVERAFPPPQRTQNKHLLSE